MGYQTQSYLQGAFEGIEKCDFAVNGCVIPTASFVAELQGLSQGESLFDGDHWLATRSAAFDKAAAETGSRKQTQSDCKRIDRNWKIFQLNEWAMREDFAWLKENTQETQPVPAGVTVIGDDILIEKGAIVRPSIINTETGPVYLAKDSEIMEGSLVRGGLALMEGSQLKMGAKIYGSTTIGPHSKVGGEVNNAVIFGYSNKGHDGFLGNSVIGEWCNLGADTNTSNLKNNYADVKIYNYALKRSESTGGQFCGLTMGDHAKSGINTMFNTGTVCGIFANVFGGDFPHRNIPDFGWGGSEGFKTFRIADALEVAEKVMIRRGIELSAEWRAIYTHLFEELTAK